MTPQDPAPPRRLARSASDRKLAGVAGGLARHFDLDPTLVRVAFVVLTLFGGVGLALYALVAVIAPSDEGAPPLSTAAKATLVVVGLIALAAFPVAVFASPAVLLVVAIVIVVYRALGGDVDGRVLRASWLVLVTTLALVAGFGAAVAAAFGAQEAMAALVIAAGLAVVAAGLRGGGRWMIVPALMLALPVSVVAAADLELDGGIGERLYRPSSVADVRSSYRLGLGELELDLRAVDLSDVRTLAIDVRLGVGRLEVTVPDGVCVSARAEVGAGVADVLGRVNEGFDVVDEVGEDAPSGSPTVVLALHNGAGEVVVDRDEGGVDPCG